MNQFVITAIMGPHIIQNICSKYEIIEVKSLINNDLFVIRNAFIMQYNKGHYIH